MLSRWYHHSACVKSKGKVNARWMPSWKLSRTKQLGIRKDNCIQSLMIYDQIMWFQTCIWFPLKSSVIQYPADILQLCLKRKGYFSAVSDVGICTFLSLSTGNPACWYFGDNGVASQNAALSWETKDIQQHTHITFPIIQKCPGCQKTDTW